MLRWEAVTQFLRVANLHYAAALLFWLDSISSIQSLNGLSLPLRFHYYDVLASFYNSYRHYLLKILDFKQDRNSWKHFQMVNSRKALKRNCFNLNIQGHCSEVSAYWSWYFIARLLIFLGTSHDYYKRGFQAFFHF